MKFIFLGTNFFGHFRKNLFAISNNFISIEKDVLLNLSSLDGGVVRGNQKRLMSPFKYERFLLRFYCSQNKKVNFEMPSEFGSFMRKKP